MVVKTKTREQLTSPQAAAVALRLLQGELPKRGQVKLSHDVVLPRAAYEMLLQFLDGVTQGKVMVLLDQDDDITTEEAARLLNVSRPYVIKLTKLGELPCHLVGKHRRLRVADVVRYRDKQRARTRKLLDELAAEAQALGEYRS